MFIRTAADIGAVIRDHRKSLGISQVDLAKRAGVGRQWLVAVEHGKPGAELAMVLRVLNALHIPLMTGAQPPDAASATIRLDDIIASARGEIP